MGNGTGEKSDQLAKIIEMFIDKKTDSISISKTSTGKYSWDVKIYSDDLMDMEKRDQVVKRIKLATQVKAVRLVPRLCFRKVEEFTFTLFTACIGC